MDYEVLDQETVIDQDAEETVIDQDTVDTEEQPEAEQEAQKSKNVPLILAIVALGVVVADLLIFGALSVLSIIPIIAWVAGPVLFLYNGLRFFIFWGSLACAIVALVMSIKSKKLDSKQKKTARILSIIALVVLAFLHVIVPIIFTLIGLILALPVIILILLLSLPFVLPLFMLPLAALGL